MEAGQQKHQNPLIFIAIFLVVALGALAVAIASQRSGERAADNQAAAAPHSPDGGSGGSPGEPGKFDCQRGTPKGFSIDDVEGKQLSAVESWAQGKDMTVRVQVEDGQPKAMTMDYRPDRVNVQVEAGVVIRYCGNG